MAAEVNGMYFDASWLLKESEVCEWRVCKDFRFLTVFGMTEKVSRSE